MKKLFFVPVGGLGNRMRAIASAVSLAQHRRLSAHVGWFQDWALNAPFSSLFETPEIAGLKIEDVPGIFYLTLDRPRKKNLYLPRLFQHFLFDQCIYEEEMDQWYQKKTDFSTFPFKGEAVYMATYQPFFPYERTLLTQLFQLNAPLRKRLDSRLQDFSAHTIGVHVRRTDNQASIQQSPLELFFETIDKELEANAELSVFLATDSEAVKADMRKRYGKRILTAEAAADRNSVSGIQDGILDLYTLAGTRRIYGSFRSSFSELAAELGNIPLTTVLKK